MSALQKREEPEKDGALAAALGTNWGLFDAKLRFFDNKGKLDVTVCQIYLRHNGAAEERWESDCATLFLKRTASRCHAGDFKSPKLDKNDPDGFRFARYATSPTYDIDEMSQPTEKGRYAVKDDTASPIEKKKRAT